MNNHVYFETRDEARQYCGANGIVQSEMQKHPTNVKERRWSVPQVAQRKLA